MAKLSGMPIPQKGFSLTEKVIISTWKGIPYMAKWPKKRGKPKDFSTRLYSSYFAAIGRSLKLFPPEYWIAARKAVQGTPLYPRDVLAMCQAGTLFYVELSDGTRRFPVQAVGKVSESLDVLAQIDNSILVRKNGLWVGIQPDAENQVLTAIGPDKVPTWANQGGGGGGELTPIAESETITSNMITLAGLTLTGYKTLQLVIDGVTLDGTGGNLRLQLESNFSFLTTGYFSNVLAYSAINTSAAFPTSGNSHFPLDGNSASWNTGPSSRGRFQCWIDLDPLPGANHLQAKWQTRTIGNTQTIYRSEGVGGVATTQNLTGMRLTVSANNITAGRLRLFGG